MAKMNSSGASPSRLVPPGSCNQNANPPVIPDAMPDKTISTATWSPVTNYATKTWSRPQQRKQKKWQAMLSELKNGDKVVTSGGLRGTIISLKDDAVTLRVPPDNLKLEVSRASVVSVTTAEEGK